MPEISFLSANQLRMVRSQHKWITAGPFLIQGVRESNIPELPYKTGLLLIKHRGLPKIRKFVAWMAMAVGLPFRFEVPPPPCFLLCCCSCCCLYQHVM